MRKNCLFWLAAVVSAVFILSGVPSVFAAGSTSAQKKKKGSSSEFTLQEITVTAQKRAQNEQKVPISMDVISGADLSGAGKTNVNNILKDISNVIINQSPGGMRVTVRGLADEASPFHDMHTSTPTVAVNIDGAYNSSSSAGQNLFDVQRIEVLAGPQSTLYGSNSPGGIVNVVTASPKTDKYEVSASLQYGNYNHIKADGMVNVPIVRNVLAMRLAAQKDKRDSWMKGGDNSQDTTSARLKTLYKPTQTFSADLTLNYSKAANGGMLGGNADLFDYQNGHWVTVDTTNNTYTKNGKVTDPWTASSTVAGPGTGNAITKGVQADIAWDTGIGSITVVPSYSHQETKNSQSNVYDMQNNLYSYTNQNITEQKGMEVRMTSPKDFFFKWIVGGTYYSANRQNNTIASIASDSSWETAKEDNKAVYANITYPITAKFKGTVGYRLSWDDVSNVETPAKVGNGHSGQNYSNPDYKLGVEYNLSQNSMFYADYATSYRVNAMVVAQGSGKTIPPERLKAYTIGAKNRFLNNRLQVNASAYFYDYTNKSFQATEDGRLGGGGGPPGPNSPPPPTINEWDKAYWHYDSNGNLIKGTDFNNDGDLMDTTNPVDNPSDPYYGNPNQTLLSNISDPWIQQFGNFQSYGVDVSTDWIITDNDRLDVSISYLHTDWVHAVTRYYWSWIWPSVNYSGQANTFSPQWSGTASYQHNFQLGSYGTLVPKVDVQYQSSYRLDFAHLGPVDVQEAHCIWNGSITYNAPSGKWSLNAYIRNATNYAVKTFWMNMAGTYALGLNDPRTFGGVVSVRF